MVQAGSRARSCYAQNNLGGLYREGKVIAKNYAEAENWIRKAAAQNFPQAQFSLGAMYCNGEGVQQDFAEAAIWFRQAAKQGFAQAQSSLDQLFDWLHKEAGKNNPEALSKLAHMYITGRGLPRNESEAFKYYRRAADVGYAVAQNNLGLIYQNGVGVPQDLAEAAKWYRKAAHQGEEEAQFNLDNLEKSNSLWPLAANLSAGDFSVFKGSADKPNSKIVTTKNSANDLFWSEMERLGWAKETPVFANRPKEISDELLGTIKSFEFTEQGQRAIDRLLPAFIKKRDNSPS